MRRRLVRTLTVAATVVLLLVALHFTKTLYSVGSTSAMHPTIPACDARVLVEGFTYFLRGPHRGEIVTIHAFRTPSGQIRTAADARDLTITRRVAGLPGDQIVGRDGTVFVNGVRFDDLETPAFPRVDLGDDQYFVLGDNRTASQDSRRFGPVQEDAISGRVLLVIWPADDFGKPESRHAGPPPGRVACGS